jgi:Notch-like protein
MCDAGFTGANCDITIVNCNGVTCSGNGQCVEGMNSYTCSCNIGFTGMLCETNIDDCVGVNCNGNGRCVDDVGASTCVCDLDYTGDSCQFQVQQEGCSGMNCSDLVVNGKLFTSINNFLVLILLSIRLISHQKLMILT